MRVPDSIPVTPAGSTKPLTQLPCIEQGAWAHAAGDVTSNIAPTAAIVARLIPFLLERSNCEVRRESYIPKAEACILGRQESTR
jgi:hypothetical protein